MNGTPTRQGAREKFDREAHREETKRRWGGTEAYRESRRRARRYGPADWARIEADGDGIVAAMAGLLTSGVPATSAAATVAAETHRRHIDRWFYPCTPAMHRALAELYTEDPRFEERFESRAAGLAAYVRRAVEANAARGSGDSRSAPEA